MELVTDNGCQLHLETEVFLTGFTGWEKALRVLEAEAAKSDTAVGVLITTPYSILLAATACGTIAVFDSHAHAGRFGALVSVSSQGALHALKAAYLSRYLLFALSKHCEMWEGAA